MCQNKKTSLLFKSRAGGIINWRPVSVGTTRRMEVGPGARVGKGREARVSYLFSRAFLGLSRDPKGALDSS